MSPYAGEHNGAQKGVQDLLGRDCIPVLGGHRRGGSVTVFDVINVWREITANPWLLAVTISCGIVPLVALAAWWVYTIVWR
jgi:hypothetical protein